MEKRRLSGKEEFFGGLREGLPIGVSYIAISFAFGLEAVEAGLSVFQAVVMSLTNITSAGQFASLDLIRTGASFVQLAMTQLVINLRYILMSTALSQRFAGREMKFFHRFGIAYGVTDEIFALSILRKGILTPAFSYGLIVIAAFGWVLGTFLGGVAARLLPEAVVGALGILVYAAFLSIIVPESRESGSVLCVVLSSMLFSAVMTWFPAFSGLESGFRIIIITVLISGLGAVLSPLVVEKSEGEGEK